MKEDELKTIAGIDTLYYFCETNGAYPALFERIQEDLEHQKRLLSDARYDNEDIAVNIGETDFRFLSKSQGFYWFRDHLEFFRVGMKDAAANTGLNDIQIQLEAKGIYALGIKSLLEYINQETFGPYVTGRFPVTRMDVNLFIQSDLSWVDKSLFSTRKHHADQFFRELGSLHITDTLYIGKKPYLMRLYNKAKELKDRRRKEELMAEVFANGGFDLEGPIFNLEFEMHRDHLKHYGVDTIGDALERAELLFKEAMGHFRMIDIDGLSESDKSRRRLYKAQTHPLWLKLENAYKLEGFYQQSAPLERIKKRNQGYTLERYFEELLLPTKKAIANGVPLGVELYMELLRAVKPIQEGSNPPKAVMVEVDVQYPDGRTESYNLDVTKPDKNGRIIPLSMHASYSLLRRLEGIRKALMQGRVTAHLIGAFQAVHHELRRRGLSSELPLH